MISDLYYYCDTFLVLFAQIIGDIFYSCFLYFIALSSICFSPFQDTLANDIFKENDYMVQFLKSWMTEYNIVLLSLLHGYFSGSKIIFYFVILQNSK